jgi:co-chaperonin GroES (HSP10)
MSFKGKCLGSNVIVLPQENKQLSEAGLDFTTVQDKNQKWGKGAVISVGENVPMDKEGSPCLKEGDIVIFDRNKSTAYIEDNIEYQAMYYTDLVKKF